MTSRRATGYALIVSAAIFLGLLFLTGQQIGAHGLTRTFKGIDNYTYSEQWPWLYVDGADFESRDVEGQLQEIAFSGVVWRGGAGQTAWRIVHNGAIRITVDGQTILDVKDNVPLTTTDVPVSWQGDQLAIEVVLKVDLQKQPVPLASRLEFGVYEQQSGNWQLLSPATLYPSTVARATAEREGLLTSVTRLGIVVLSIVILALLLFMAWQFRLWRYEIVYWAVGLAVIACIARLIVLSDRAASDPLFYWITPGGDDNYMLMARQMLAHHYQLAGTLWQPGNILWMSAIVTLFDPHLTTAYIINAVVSSLGTCAVVGAAWLAFGRRAGIVAGILAALYPPLIFYQATLQTVPMDSVWIELAFLAGVYALQRASLRAAALFGLIAGIATLFRAVDGLILLAFLLCLFVIRKKINADYGARRALTLGALSISFIILALVPQTLLNLSVGVVSPISSNGPITFFAGNNRDTDGSWANRGTVFDAVLIQGKQWSSALLQDVKADPVRIGSLYLRKIADFWDQTEWMSNVDYVRSGITTSTLLRILSLNGQIGMLLLSLLGWFGIALIWIDAKYRENPAVLLITGMLIMIILGTALFVFAGRLRVPAMPLLCIAAAVGIDRLIAGIRNVSYRLKLLGVAASSILLLVIMSLIIRYLPFKSFFYGEPSSATSAITIRDANFNNQLRFIGFSDVHTDHKPGGSIYLTLYWEALTVIPEDLSAALVFTDSQNQRIVGADWQLGTISYPPVTTSHWRQGAKLAESVLLRFPSELPAVLTARLFVYHRKDQQSLPIMNADGKSVNEDRAFLFHFGVLQPNSTPAPLHSPSTTLNAIVADALHVTASAIPQSINAKDGLPVAVQMEATAPIWEDYVLFFHLVDSQDRLVAQSDNIQLVDDWTTSALIPSQPIVARRTLDLPVGVATGDYRLMMGFYAYPSLQRIPATDAQHNPLQGSVIYLGQVHIQN